MKKILIFAFTAIIILSTLVISTFAMKDVPYSYVLEFEQKSKAYPIASSVDDAVPFFEYYEVTQKIGNIYFTKQYEDAEINFTANRNLTTISVDAKVDGSYPYFRFNFIEPTDGSYNDFAIISNNNNFSVVGFKDGVKSIVKEDFNESFYNAYGNTTYYFSDIVHEELSEGYFVEFPKTPTEFMVFSVVGNITDSIGTFVLGFGSSFARAFEAVFMIDGQFNALSIFLLVLFGCSLAYGCIRWITSLFRKET